MGEMISLLSASPSPVERPDVQIFDPPMCCSSGLCGPVLDQALLDVNEMLSSLQARGLRVERYQMASNPKAFLGHAEVLQLVRERQMEALPITVVRGRVLKVGSYATAVEIEAALTQSAA
jgi:hypothetical protein